MECSVHGCLRARHQSKEFCAAHYQRVRKHGDPGSPRIVYRWGDACTALNCSLPHVKMGYCEIHLATHRSLLEESEPILVCSKCGANPRESPYERGIDGLHAWCRQCLKSKSKSYKKSLDPAVRKQRDRVQALRKRGLTLEQYDQMFQSQNGVCAICGQPETRINYHSGEPVSLHVDHDHVTGVNRALLCGRCNTGIGMLQDSPTIAARAAEYLRHHHGFEGQLEI